MQALRGVLRLLLFATLFCGCAHEAGQAQAPAPGWAAGWVLPAGNYEFPPKTLPRKTEAEPTHPTPGNTPTATAMILSPLRFAAGPGVPTYADARPRPLAPELI